MSTTELYKKLNLPQNPSWQSATNDIQTAHDTILPNENGTISSPVGNVLSMNKNYVQPSIYMPAIQNTFSSPEEYRQFAIEQMLNRASDEGTLKEIDNDEDLKGELFNSLQS